MLNKTRLFSLLVSLCLISFLAACGDDSAGTESGGGNETTDEVEESDNTPQCGDSSRTGTTNCDIIAGECTAGQYCNSEQLTCSVGCLSDANCGGNQFCDLDGGVPGTCRNCNEFTPEDNTNDENTNDETTGGNSCPEVADHLIDYCSHLVASDRSYIVNICTDVITSDERQCIVDGDTCAESLDCIEHLLDEEWDVEDETPDETPTEVTDFGDVCDFNQDCDDACVREDEFDFEGYCTATCTTTDNDHCPAGWTCESVPAASARYCLQP